jgi:hypothetical protein
MAHVKRQQGSPATKGRRRRSDGQLASAQGQRQREVTMPLTRARYDGHADWYAGWNQPHAEANAAHVLDLLGPGQGLCLDLGCGCGHYLDALASTRADRHRA